MPLSHTVFPSSSPADVVRQALIGSLHQMHRPELADVVAAADLAYDFTGVWLRPADASLSTDWLEQQLLNAALASGLPLTSIHVLETAGRGSATGEMDQ